MHTLKVTLKQHTPLIHFQHDQENATLRASEVKPKLDRFILSSLYDGISDDEYDEVADFFQRKKTGEDFDELSREEQSKEVEQYIVAKYKWLIGKGEHSALNYKLRINISDNPNTKEYLIASYINNIEKLESDGIHVLNHTPYFAQEKENSVISKSRNSIVDWRRIGKKGIMEKYIKENEIEKGIVYMTFVSINDTLLKYISSQIQTFMLSTNFGTRQSKGFGSFTVAEIKLNEDIIPLKNDEELIKKYFSFVYYKDIEDQDGLNGIFSTINSDYRLIKSGTTYPKYKKSKFMLWGDKKNIGWDKKYIKSQFSEQGCPYKLKSSHNTQEQSYSERDEYRYYRAMLGLAEQFEFLLDNPPLGDKNNKLIVKVGNPDIKRYKSPLLFKVIGCRIYLVGNSVSKKMLNKSFSFMASIMKDEQWKDFSLGELLTPSSFILKDFIQFAMEDKRLEYKQLK